MGMDLEKGIGDINGMTLGIQMRGGAIRTIRFADDITKSKDVEEDLECIGQ